MEVYTVRQTRKTSAKMPVLDISGRSESTPALKTPPTWDMITGYLLGRLSEEQYAREYHRRLDENEGELAAYFGDPQRMPGGGRIALTCGCSAGTFCHRILLAKWLAERLGWEYMGEIE